MDKMSRQAMDKLIDDHFMYEATADLEGVLRTYAENPEHQVVGGRTARCAARRRSGVSTQACFLRSRASAQSR
jgi:hypothetical protein